MRVATFVLIGLQALFVAALIIGAATTRSDPAGQGVVEAYAMIGAFAFVVLALPALALALFTGLQWLAFALAILGISVLILSMMFQM